ncbi:MAG: nickel-dependent lactate racemase [Chloroflexi bacterium]|nr:nickel-dependent lactate racemase [Chloroflexota bacterium]
MHIPYGKSTLPVSLPEHVKAEWVMPRDAEPAANPRNVVAQALANSPLPTFENINSVAIAINDKTRPVPHEYLLPPLLEQLSDKDITFVIATGLHDPMPPDEFNRILPADIIEKYRVTSHDAKDDDMLVHLGKTSRGTPVFANKYFMEADLRIVVGNIEPHQFMGFSGGVKSAAIGLAGAATINHNHAIMTHEKAILGQYEGNPAREDVEEIGRMLRVDFALNAILNSKKQIVNVLAGYPVDVMREGIPLVKAIYEVPVAAPFDVMIASPGGHPKDINMYQAQKALAHAARVMKPDGTVILVAACPEGSGSESYENWVAGKQSHEDVLESFAREGFKVGPHKAFQLSRDSVKVRVLLVSEMPDELARKLLFHPIPSLDKAIEMALRDLPADARIGIMPVANATIAVLK